MCEYRWGWGGRGGGHRKRRLCTCIMPEAASVRARAEVGRGARVLRVGLCTILQLPILYGVWQKKGGVGGASYIAQSTCNSIAIVRVVQVGGGYKRMIDLCTNDLR